MRKNQAKLFGIVVIMFLLIPVFVLAQIPNDPNVEQWGYEDTGVYGAWEKTTGSRDVVVAVIDNGFDTFHPDLRGNVWKNLDEIEDNGVDDDHNGYIDDIWGWNFNDDNNDPRPDVSNLNSNQIEDGVFNHGTLVAGIIGARGNNNLDGAGLNWQVKLMNLKVIGNSGTGESFRLAEAIRYAVDNGANIINISMVGNEDSDIKQAIKFAYEKKVAIFAAVGNDMFSFSDILRYPVCADSDEEKEWVLGVTMVDENHYNVRQANIGSQCVDIAAPGVNISSVVRYSPADGLDDRYSSGWTGTSFATPFVAGTAALIKAIHPEWGPDDIYNTLVSTVHHTPNKDEELYANLFGAGLLQVDKAIEYALAQIKTVHFLNGILSIEAKTGEIATREVNTQRQTESVNFRLKNIVDVAKFTDRGDVKFATVANIDENNSLVTIYNEDWRALSFWPVSLGGELEIVAGDVNGDGKTEVVLAPQYSDDLIFAIYSLAGTELKQKTINGAHQGVSLGLFDKGESEFDILAIYRNQDGIVNLQRYDKNFNVIKRILLPFLVKRGVIGSGDIDGDSEQELVVAGGAGEQPVIVYYESDGSLIRKFSSYASSYQTGLNLIVGDYNDDKKDDVIVSLKSADQPVRVWDYKVKKIGEWSVFGGEDVSLKLLGI